MKKENNLLRKARIIKVVVNVGVKEGAKDEGLLTKQAVELANITGQKAKVCRAKKSIAGFKLGKGMPIGLKVTLRKKRMNDFLQKLFTIVLPRVRDFRGLSAKGFDGAGNYTLGIKEQTVFPETEYSKADKIMGLEVTIVTSTEDNGQAQELLMSIGAPFVDDKGKFIRK
jgi:large subunit ribosomal protein L5